jgi:hypothetical protein
VDLVIAILNMLDYGLQGRYLPLHLADIAQIRKIGR